MHCIYMDFVCHPLTIALLDHSARMYYSVNSWSTLPISRYVMPMRSRCYTPDSLAFRMNFAYFAKFPATSSCGVSEKLEMR